MPLQTAVVEPEVARKKRTRSRIIAAIVGTLVAIAVIAVAIASTYAGRIVCKHLVQAIEQHYHAKVELKSFTVLVFPRIVVHGEGLSLRKDGRTDVAPFISVENFTADASILDLLRNTKRIQVVTLEGLRINIGHQTQPAPRDNNSSENTGKKKVPDFVIEEVKADGTKLTITPKDPKKDPLVFDIRKLHLKHAGNESSMHYEATLTNATPPGLIQSQGRFGPFNTDDAGKTPLGGKYQFRDADLSVFKGISGTLASNGEFEGTLENIEVQGTTNIPNFQVRDSGHPVDLKTEFHATVDGTNGDTVLDPVNVSFKDTQLVARGKVDGVPGMNGKAVALTVNAERARIENLLMLVLKDGQPPLTGDANFHTSFVLEPGHGDVLDRLQLKGTFGLEQTKFSKPTLQQKIAKFSNKAQGNHQQPIQPGDTAANFHGSFTLSNALAQFSQLQFDVPGARVSLEGNYNVDSEKLDFRGHLQMDAKLSQMTTGVKSFFARLVQPLVTKHDDTVIPIKITGTRSDPKFGVQVGKLLKRQ